MKRRPLIPRHREVLTTGGVLASIFGVLFGIALLALVAALLIETFADGFAPLDLFETVGRARRAPLWLALVAAGLAVVAGVMFIVESTGYLVRAARGELPRPAGDPRARREHRARKASAHQRRVWARSAWARRRRDS